MYRKTLKIVKKINNLDEINKCKYKQCTYLKYINPVLFLVDTNNLISVCDKCGYLIKNE